MKQEQYLKYHDWKANNHWFEAGRLKIFKNILESCVNGNNLKILDVGCGIGEMLDFFKKFGTCFGMEMHGPYAEIARRRGHDVREARLEDWPFDNEKFDLISFFDVLEHIEDDEGALVCVNKALKSGGFLAIAVPAWQIIWGQADILGQHKRRYRASLLKNKLEKNGFNVIRLTYYNSILAPIIFCFLLLKRFLTLNNKIKTRANHEYFQGNKYINNFLKKILFLEAKYLAKHNLPFGMSIFAIARKREN